jgi:energy-coupling factor transport system permease protein
MFKYIPLGLYVPGKSLLHRLQARTKWILLLWIVIWVLIANQRQWHFIPYIALGGLIAIALIISKISLRDIGRKLWLVLILLAIGFIPGLFTYSNGDTLLHSFGPWMLPRNSLLILLLIGCGFMFICLMFSWVPFLRRSVIQRRLRRMNVLLIFAFIVLVGCLVFILRSSNHAFLFGPLRMSYEGVWSIFVFTMMLLYLLLVSQLLTMTTSPVALIEGLTMLMAPLRKLKLPVDDFALMALLALRFIPTLLEEAEQLTKAQSARGADFMSGTVRERLQSLIMLIVAFMQGALRRSEELAVALESRGYQADGEQTLLYEKKLGRIDYLVIGSVMLVSICSLLI